MSSLPSSPGVHVAVQPVAEPRERGDCQAGEPRGEEQGRGERDEKCRQVGEEDRPHVYLLREMRAERNEIDLVGDVRRQRPGVDAVRHAARVDDTGPQRRLGFKGLPGGGRDDGRGPDEERHFRGRLFPDRLDHALVHAGDEEEVPHAAASQGKARPGHQVKADRPRDDLLGDELAAGKAEVARVQERHRQVVRAIGDPRALIHDDETRVVHEHDTVRAGKADEVTHHGAKTGSGGARGLVLLQEEAHLVEVHGKAVLQLLHVRTGPVPVSRQLGLQRAPRGDHERGERERSGDGDLQKEGAQNPDEELGPKTHYGKVITEHP